MWKELAALRKQAREWDAASMTDMTEVKTDVSGAMRTKIKEWASGICVHYKDRLKTPLISRVPETVLLSKAIRREVMGRRAIETRTRAKLRRDRRKVE
jgi:hypothetical protein